MKMSYRNATAVLMLSTAVVVACPPKAEVAQAKAEYSCCPKALSGKVAKVMNSLPTMTYRVGEFNTPCRKTAESKAAADAKVLMVVDGQAYDTEAEAALALAALLDQKSQEMRTIQFSANGKTYKCPVSAKGACKDGERVQYVLAGVTFASRERADEALNYINRKAGCDKAACDKAQTASASGCGKATTVAATKSGCNKSAKATTVAATKSGCNKGATVAAKSGCNKSAKATTVAATKSGCNKGAAVAAKSGCNKSAKATTVAATKSGCNKGAAVAAKSGCNKSAKATTVAATKSGCDKSAKAASGCSKSAKSASVVSNDKPSCCPMEAQQQVADAQARIRQMVEAAASVALGSSS